LFGDDVNTRFRPLFQAGVTPLHIACWSEVPASVRLLLDAGADINAETSVNQRRGSHELTRLLVWLTYTPILWI
jgi:hypothetical protein